MKSNSSAPRDPASDRKRIGVWENEGGGLDEQAGDSATVISAPTVIPREH